MNRTARSALVLALVAAGVAAADIADAPTRADAAPPGAARVSLIGDSTMMSMHIYPNDDEVIAQDYDVLLDAQSCRRLVVGSCRGRFGSTPRSLLPLIRTTYDGQLGQVLVVMAGYDDFHDISGDIDAIMAEANSQGVSEVFWLTYRSNVSYDLPGGAIAGAPVYRRHNADLQAATIRWPNLRLLDWDSYSAAQPSWFSSDGIHLTPAGSVQLAAFIKSALDSRAVVRCTDAHALTGSPTAAADVAPAVAEAAGFEGIEPVRVIDTRDPERGGESGKLGAGRAVTVALDDVLPPGTVAAALTVTAVDPCRTGYLTVFPCGSMPTASNVNYVAMRNTASLVVTMLDDGDVCVYSSAPTDLIVDVLGGFTPGGAPFHPITPTRWVDTRANPAQIATDPGVRSAGEEITVPIAGRGGVPSAAEAVLINLTTAGSTGATAVAAYPGPCGQSPGTSTVNVSAGRDGASSAIVQLGDDGSLCLSTFSGGGHLILDVAGWFGPGSGGLELRASTPQRLADTRLSGAGAVVAGSPVAVEITAPSMLSVAIVDPSGTGWASAKPCGATETSSLVNTMIGEPMANATALGPGDGGAICVTPSMTAHVIVDRTGTFVPA